MALGKKQQQQGVVVASSEPSVARRMWRVLRAVLYMLRRGLPSGRKLAMDLHLLLHRGKIAGKALGYLLTSHNHHHRDAAAAGFSSYSYAGAGAARSSSSFSCRALDPALAVHEPSSRRCGEVEFSCSNTPSSAEFGGLLGKRGRRRNGNRGRRDVGYLQYYHNYDAADVARVFEMLNDDGLFGAGDGEQEQHSTAATPLTVAAYKTPSPARLLWALARSPAVISRKMRVAESVSPAAASGGADEEVGRQADEFIRRFYEQLRAQRSAASTPGYYGYSSAAASPYVAGTGRRKPRAIPAGIA